MNITEKMRNRAKVVVNKYISDQIKYPDMKGTSFVTTAHEFDSFMEAVREANPQIPAAELGFHALRHSEDRSIADTLMAVIHSAANDLRNEGRTIPNIPNLFEQDVSEQAPSILSRFKPSNN